MCVLAARCKVKKDKDKEKSRLIITKYALLEVIHFVRPTFYWNHFDIRLHKHFLPMPLAFKSPCIQAVQSQKKLADSRTDKHMAAVQLSSVEITKKGLRNDDGASLSSSYGTRTKN